eukprot:m.561829 g.561829  ORF g.561829 m.561829 type:complete len:114 (-) comp57796_c0_seq52:817-1158(-)
MIRKLAFKALAAVCLITRHSKDSHNGFAAPKTILRLDLAHESYANTLHTYACQPETEVVVPLNGYLTHYDFQVSRKLLLLSVVSLRFEFHRPGWLFHSFIRSGLGALLLEVLP